MTDALTGSDLDRIRHERHQRLVDKRATQLAARRDEVLTVEFLERALTSKRGLKHVHAAIGLEAGGHTGGITPRQVRDAVQALFANQGKTTNGK
jgi:hypothetical protein